MELLSEDAFKLGLSILVGGLIGAEREFRDKSAGLRTIIFITIGSTLFTMLSPKLGDNDHTARVAANIVTGIGFLGAGAIVREGARIAGLTTAATIWLAASLGMGIGIGQYALTLAATPVILVILLLFPLFDDWIDHIREARTYEILLPLKTDRAEEIMGRFRQVKLHTSHQRIHKTENGILIIAFTRGSPKKHARLVQMLLSDSDIKELRY